MKLVIDGLRLPTLNKVLRMHWRARQKEVKRVRELVSIAGIQAGYANAIPLRKARVRIRAYGKYGRRDGEGTLYKDCVDAIVARPLPEYPKERRWGLIMDDNRECIGDADLKTVEADSFRVTIEVTSK